MYEQTFFASPPQWMVVLAVVAPLVAWFAVRLTSPAPLGLARAAVAFLLGMGMLLLLVDRPSYERLLYENGPIELWTALALFVAGVAAWTDARGRSEATLRRCLGAALVLAAFEELSWGQNLFQWESPDVFRDWNAQDETNLHNITQQVFHTKGATIVVLLAYGVVGPLLARRSAAHGPFVHRLLRLAPSPSFAPLFGIAAVLCLDVPTGLEAELGELLGALLFCIAPREGREEGAPSVDGRDRALSLDGWPSEPERHDPTGGAIPDVEAPVCIIGALDASPGDPTPGPARGRWWTG